MKRNKGIPWTVQWGFPFLSGNVKVQEMELVRSGDRLVVRTGKLWRGVFILAVATFGVAAPLALVLSWRNGSLTLVKAGLLAVTAILSWIGLYHSIARPRRIEVPYATGDIELFDRPGPEPAFRIQLDNIRSIEIAGYVLRVEIRDGKRFNVLSNPHRHFVEAVRQALEEVHRNLPP